MLGLKRLLKKPATVELACSTAFLFSTVTGAGVETADVADSQDCVGGAATFGAAPGAATVLAGGAATGAGVAAGVGDALLADAATGGACALLIATGAAGVDF